MPNNEFYTQTGFPGYAANGDSASARAELLSIQNGFDKLPALSGMGLRVVRVNAGGTALESVTLTTAKILASDGSVTPIANLPMGGYKLTGLGAATVAGDAVRYEQAGLIANPLSQFAATTSAQLAGVLSDETGTGSAVFSTSPTLVTPLLGTPTSGVLTNCTGTAAGLTAGTVTTNANLTGAITSVGNATSLGSFTSANLATALTDETGSGAAVFATSPTLVTPALGTPASGALDNCTSNTETAANNSTQLATTAYADRLTGGTLAGAFTTLSASGVVNASTNFVIGEGIGGGKLQVKDASATSTTTGVNGILWLSSKASGADITLGFSDGVTYNHWISAKAGHITTQVGTSTSIITDVSSTGLAVTGTITSTVPAAGAFTTLSASGETTGTSQRLSAGTSSTTLAGNYALRLTAGATATNYAGLFFDGSTVYDSFFGRVPTALSGINDSIGYVTYVGGVPTLRTLFSSTGLAVTGQVSPSAHNTYDLGTTALRWKDLWLQSGAFNGSDARLKTAIAPLTTNEINAAKQLSKEIGTYQWLESVQKKGDVARHHVGFTVQRAIEILQANGCDPFSYGFIGYDKWDDVFVEHAEILPVTAVEGKEPVLDADGNEIEPAIADVEAVEGKAAWTEHKTVAGDAYSFRYDQLNMFVAAGLEARLSALESR